MSKQNLLGRTYQLLDQSDLNCREIAAGTGVDINWLFKFKKRSIGEPGVKKVQAVYDFLRLSGKKRVRADGRHAA